MTAPKPVHLAGIRLCNHVLNRNQGKHCNDKKLADRREDVSFVLKPEDQFSVSSQEKNTGDKKLIASPPSVWSISIQPPDLNQVNRDSIQQRDSGKFGQN